MLEIQYRTGLSAQTQLRHENGDEGKQENQYSTSDRQHDRHKWNDGLDHVLWAVV